MPMHNFGKDLMSTNPGQLASAGVGTAVAPAMSPAAQFEGTAAPRGTTVRAVNNGISTSTRPTMLTQGKKLGLPSESIAATNNPFRDKISQAQPPPGKMPQPAVPGSKPPLSPTNQVSRGDGTDGPVINDSSVPPLNQYAVKSSPTFPQPQLPEQQGQFMPPMNPMVPPKVANDIVSAAILCRMIKLSEQIAGEKRANVPLALTVPTLLGAGYGFGRSAKGSRTSNTLRGAATGLGSGAGMIGGGLGGSMLANSLGVSNPWAQLAFLLGGAGAGGLGGGMLTKSLLKKLTGKDMFDRRYDVSESEIGSQ